MVNVRGDVLLPPHCTTPAPVKANKNQKWDLLRAMKTFIRKKMGHTKLFLEMFVEWSFTKHIFFVQNLSIGCHGNQNTTCVKNVHKTTH